MHEKALRNRLFHLEEVELAAEWLKVEARRAGRTYYKALPCSLPQAPKLPAPAKAPA